LLSHDFADPTFNNFREFHYGPDESQKNEEEAPHVQQIDHHKRGTQPPESTFKKLGPSKQRYTILERDEL
jgi:endoplasmic reticulum resident protein 44